MNRSIPLILAVALLMEQMDSTVIATSLPAIAADIGTSPIALKLALTAYLVALAIFIPVSGWMADRFGAKRVFRIAILVFVAGSILCAVSGSLIAFVLSRFLQGMGGAMMTPVARLVLVRAVPRNELVSAMAWLTIPALIGPIIGPPLGGFITTFFTWHWIFLINVPIGLAGIVASGYVLPEIGPGPPRRFDLPGLLLAGTAASGVVFGLSVVSLPALPPAVGIAAVAAGVLAAVGYVVHARGHAAPVLDLGLFAKPVFRQTITGSSLFRVGAGATPFLLPLMFQIGFGLSPFQSGMVTFVSAGGAMAMKFIATSLLRAGGFRTVLLFAAVAGSLLSAAVALFMPGTPYVLIFAVLFASGFIRSLFFTSANALVFADIRDEEASQATAIASVAQQISIALGVALAGGVLELYTLATGRPLELDAFATAFIGVGAVMMLSIFPFLQLTPDAGSAVSGHSRRMAAHQPPG